MSSSSDDDDLLLTLLLTRKRKKTVKRKNWVHPHNLQRAIHGTFEVTKGMRTDPKKFQSFYRMLPETFDILVSKVLPHLQRKDTNYRSAICVEERLLITLRYLATGETFRSLSFHFMRGETTIGGVVEDTCNSLWDVLWPEYMPTPTKETWKEIAKKFLADWQMPNCIGAIDGKHVRIRCPSNSGSAFYNYESYFSIVLLAVVDAESNFISISVGDYGRNSDGGVLRTSAFGQLLANQQLDIPPPHNLPMEHHSLPYYFVADSAFPLKENIMRPYPARGLTDKRRVFNLRLSRARKTVECAFGRMASKFRVLYTPIGCSPRKVDAIVKATCILHNFISRHDGSSSVEREEDLESFGDPLDGYTGRPTTSAIANRDMLADHFLKVGRSLPWQWMYC